MPNPLEVLKRAQNLPVDGRLLTIADLMQEFQCSRRQVEMLIETGAIVENAEFPIADARWPGPGKI